MSATITKDVETLKGIALRNPAILKLEEDKDEAANLTQYAVRCSEVDKFLLTYVILKLKLVKGKCLIFVNDVDRGYRVKLFLEQFSIKSCVLNSELPLNSRFHIVQEFNKGVYDYIIATDETGGKHEDQDTDDEQEVEEEERSEAEAGAETEVSADLITTEPEPTEASEPGPSNPTSKRKRGPSSQLESKKSSKKHRTTKKDKEFGVSRGIDFVDVACVLNFDLPRSSRAYTHRVGRTARAGRSGMALSFVVPEEEFGKDKVLSCASSERDEIVFARIEKEQGARGSKLKDYVFDMAQVEAFRYRMEDALRAVTKSAVREARVKELKTELLNSEKLKTHFEENPLDLEYIRHDKSLHPTRVQAHMKHVPKYLMPRIASVTEEPAKDVGFVPFTKPGSRGRGRGRGSGRGGKKKSDPLKKFGRLISMIYLGINPNSPEWPMFLALISSAYIAPLANRVLRYIAAISPNRVASASTKMSESKAPGIVESKDFGDFERQKETIEARTAHAERSKRARIIELISSTEEQLQTSNSIIQNAVTLGESFKVTKQIVNTLLAPAKELADLLGSLSEIHPAIGVVATVFQYSKAVVRLETDRQENDRQIAVLYDSMSHMLIALVYMEEIFERKDGIQHMLTQKLDEIADLIKEFGNFCDVYYKSRSIVRFLRSGKYKEKLSEFAQRFEGAKNGLQNLISHRTAKLVDKTSRKIDEIIATSIPQLVKFMDIQTSRERETAALVASKGGTEADDNLLDEIAQKMGEKITASVQLRLRQDLAQQLADNRLFFDVKMQGVTEQISEKIERSTNTILLKMEDGPHELIHDPDIKKIWKGERWGHSVKGRYFVSAVHHHFEQTFIRYRRENGTSHPDLWTLNYLSRVIFYPAIGDAIDEDNSGFVSLHELNHFLDSRPQGWSVPQWLSYWAAGWYKDNLRYRDKIMSRLKLLEDMLDSLRPENKDVFRVFIENIKPQIRRIVLSLYDDILDYFQGEGADSNRLEDLRNQFTAITTKEVEEQLAKSKFEIDDNRTLMLVLGRSRFESRLFCVMHRLLKRHHKVFDLGRDNLLQEGVAISMVNSWDVIFDAFVQRMRELGESWRQQRVDVDLQVQWYANGLFEDWYIINKGLPEAEDDYGDAWAEEDYDAGTEVDENELAEYATRPPTATGDYEDDFPTIIHSLDQEHLEGDPMGDMEVRTVASASDQTLHPGECYHGRSSSRATNESGRTSTAITELEERMAKLEGKVDNLTDLMMQILQQLKDK
ncbi:unnamed protein product [Rhizoctonia solani]|uniref:RNA helicase n=1 Tax=Rhizoctonia solani TaxID=456999 RepID=A0A8H2WKH7_9AGAM|nr:unnamed protein product [Rhizoctonia solani]